MLSRADLAAGRAGPLIVEEYDSTCVVPPGARAERDGAGNIVITLVAPSLLGARHSVALFGLRASRAHDMRRAGRPRSEHERHGVARSQQ